MRNLGELRTMIAVLGFFAERAMGNFVRLLPVIVTVFAAFFSGAAQAQEAVALTVRSCIHQPQAWCLEAAAGTTRREFQLSPNRAAHAVLWGTIGNHFPGSLPAAYVYWETGAPEGGVAPSIALTIFDLNGAGPVAQTVAPGANPSRNFRAYTIHDTYFGIVRGPQGKQYPFLAPGQRHLNEPFWTYLCIFDPTAISSLNPSCGRGFKPYSATFPNAERLAGFRHNGGWIQDTNNDGWDDINLPFLHGYILVIEGRTGAHIALNHIEPAKPDPYYKIRPVFDSGRLYGSYTPFTSVEGKQDVLIAAGNPVGTFDDVDCNVSRYFAVLETEVPNDPQSRRLKWSDYISFMKTVFQNPPPPTMAEARIGRPGDFINKCVHRVSDSVFYAGQRPITIYNYFVVTPLISHEPCQQLNLKSWEEHFPVKLQKEWRTCADNAGLSMTGIWSAQALDLENGRGINQWPNAYFWDRVYNFVPGQREVFLVEPMPNPVRFDQKGYSPQPLMVAGIDANFRWQRFGSFPVAGRPHMTPSTPYWIPIGIGVGASWRGVWSAVTRPRPDGLVDIQLQDGRWIGYSSTQHTFVVQP